jgi:hypothetical protein
MAVLTLDSDIKADGLNQGTLHTFLTNLVTVINELVDDHATNRTHVNNVTTLVNQLRTNALTRCVTPPNFEIDTNFDIQNGDAFEIISNGVLATIATDQSFDTGTDTVIATDAYWAAGILSIDIDGTTYVDWGAEAASEAAAITALSAVTASGEVVCGYVTVHAAAGQDWVAGTDALTTGTGGQVAQATNYYNAQFVGDAALGAAVATSPAATLTNATDLTLSKG